MCKRRHVRIVGKSNVNACDERFKKRVLRSMCEVTRRDRIRIEIIRDRYVKKKC